MNTQMAAKLTFQILKYILWELRDIRTKVKALVLPSSGWSYVLLVLPCDINRLSIGLTSALDHHYPWILWDGMLSKPCLSGEVNPSNSDMLSTSVMLVYQSPYIQYFSDACTAWVNTWYNFVWKCFSVCSRSFGLKLGTYE